MSKYLVDMERIGDRTDRELVLDVIEKHNATVPITLNNQANLDALAGKTDAEKTHSSKIMQTARWLFNKKTELFVLTLLVQEFLNNLGVEVESVGPGLKAFIVNLLSQLN